MAFDLSDMADQLFADLTDKNIGLIKQSEPEYDLNTGLPLGTGSESKTYCRGFTDQISANLIDGTNILTGDELLYLERSADYELGDVLEIRGDKWTAVNPVDYAPTGKRQFWKIQVRRQ